MEVLCRCGGPAPTCTNCGSIVLGHCCTEQIRDELDRLRRLEAAVIAYEQRAWPEDMEGSRQLAKDYLACVQECIDVRAAKGEP